MRGCAPYNEDTARAFGERFKGRSQQGGMMSQPASADFCRRPALVAIFLLAGCGTHDGVERTARANEAFVSTWVATGAMHETRYDHAAARLSDGRVLVTGGFGDKGAVTASAEIYDPATNTWSPAAPMPVARQKHGAALLGDGRVLVGGGSDSSYVTYDPATDTWSGASAPPSPPSSAQLTSLPDGRVLASCQYLYDPTADTWSATAASSGASGGDLLPDGTVFCRTAIYHPTSDTWTPVQGAWAEPSGLAACAATNAQYVNAHAPRVTSAALSDGRVIVVAATLITCKDNFVRDDLYLIPSIYDPATQVWTKGQLFTNWGIDPAHSGVAALGDGTALIFTYVPGGCGAYAYTPASDTWQCTSTNIGQMPYPLPGSNPPIDGPLPATATLLDDGTLLWSYTTFAFAGANGAYRYGYAQSTLGQPCVADAQCASGHCADAVCCDTACNGGPCDACSVAAGAAADGTCALFSGLPCDDGDACTQTDACQNGVCVGGNPIECTAPDACHVGSCDPATGTCHTPAAPDGTTCPEGACQAGACVSAPDGGGVGGSGSGGSGGGTSSSSSSGSGGFGGGASSSATSGSGGAASTPSTSSSASSSSSGDAPTPGGGCALAREDAPEAPRAWAALVLLALAWRVFLARRHAR
jgi:hypothetical protein